MTAQMELALRTPARGVGPGLLAIAESWLDRPDWPEYLGNVIGMGEPFCAACGWLVPVPPDLSDAVDQRSMGALWRYAARFLDRAHLVDHAEDGLDGIGNLIQICHLCHRRMPSFKVGDASGALAWVRSQERRPGSFQLFTDAAMENDADGLRRRTGDSSRSWLRRAWLFYLEHMNRIGASA